MEKYKFQQGYACAIANLIRLEGITPTVRNLYKSGLGEFNLVELRAFGIDDLDIEVFKTYENELNPCCDHQCHRQMSKVSIDSVCLKCKKKL